ncbi:MAG TPA: helix-turn-helix domain-containing protein [Steroidobacteraceae bacterium]
MTQLRRRNPVSDCPLTAALAAMGGRWKLIIIHWLARGPTHFAALKREMSAVSQKVLTEQLRELTDDGIVTRHATGEVPAPVIYSLTDYGRTLAPIAESIRVWGHGHIKKFAD